MQLICSGILGCCPKDISPSVVSINSLRYCLYLWRYIIISLLWWLILCGRTFYVILRSWSLRIRYSLIRWCVPLITLLLRLSLRLSLRNGLVYSISGLSWCLLIKWRICRKTVTTKIICTSLIKYWRCLIWLVWSLASCTGIECSGT